MIKDTFANRLKRIMSIRNMRPIDIANKTNISKSQFSKWLSGKYKARQDTLTTLAEIFDVNEAWLMGFDVPMERTEDKVTKKDIVVKKELNDNIKQYTDLELLFLKNQNILTTDDKEYIKFIIEKRKKEVKNRKEDK